MHTVSVFHVDWDQLMADDNQLYLIRPEADQALALFEHESTRLVAEVTYPADQPIEDALKYAYMLTNNIPWHGRQAPKLKVHMVDRSTSVGDIMAVGDALFLVKSAGFKRLPSPAQ